MRLRSNRETSDYQWVSAVDNDPVQMRRTRKTKSKSVADADHDYHPRKRFKKQASSVGKCSSPPSTSGSVPRQVGNAKENGADIELKQELCSECCKENTDLLHINNIPGHILISVFSFLPVPERIRIERVCRYWRYMAKNYSWKYTASLTYSSLAGDKICPLSCLLERPIIGNAEIKSLTNRCGRYLRELDLHAFRDTLTYNVCMNFASNCPNLTSLDMNGIQLTNSSLSLIGRHCPSLENVNFHRCFQVSVVERGLSSFFSKCCSLRELDISENERITGSSFSLLPRSITSLKIGGCYRLSSEALVSIKNRCPNLVTLMMSGVDNVSLNVTLYDLNDFFLNLEKLERLRFGECLMIAPTNGPEINLSSMKNLTELTLNDNALISDRVLQNTVNHCRNIMCLDLSGCNSILTNDGLTELSRLSHLKYLNLSLIKVLSDDVIKSIARKGVLETLLINHCEKITDDAISELLKHCPNLTALDVSYCPKVTDSSMEAIIKYVKERKKREAALPEADRMLLKKEDRMQLVVTQLLSSETSLQAILNADIDRHMIRFENFRYRFIQPEELCEFRTTLKSASSDYTRLHVWIGHSGIKFPCKSLEPFLVVDDTELVPEHPSSIFEFSVIIRIN